MRLVLRTKVDGNYKEVMNKFDRDLFLALAPPFPKIELKEFTGSQKGDVVKIRFKAPVNKDWVSDITGHGSTDDEAYFIDEGRVLPWPLKKWKHIHIVRKISENESEIVDDINYGAGNRLMSVLMYPALLLGFLPRKRIYKRYFSTKN